MRVQHNITAMNSYRNFKSNNSSLSKNLEKLSSGYAINRAGDNAAGLAISEKMRAQITGLDVAQKNANDGISLVQTAEGALTEVHSMLNRMYELAEQSANGTYESSVDRAQLQKEVDALKDEINRIADSANFNGIQLLDGSLSSSKTEASATSKFVEATDKTTETLVALDLAEQEVNGTDSVLKNKPVPVWADAVGSPAEIANSGAAVLGENTIPSVGDAVDGVNSQFAVNLNDFSVEHASKLTISIGSDNLEVDFTTADVGEGLSGEALAQKIVDNYKAQTNEDGVISIGGNDFTMSAQGSKLIFESAESGALSEALDVSIASAAVDFKDTAIATTGFDNTKVGVGFTWNTAAANADKTDFATAATGLEAGFSIEQGLSDEIDAADLVHSNTTSAPINTSTDTVFSYTVDSRTVSITGKPAAEIAASTEGHIADATKSYKYIANGTYDAGDTVKLSLKEIGSAGDYTYWAKNAGGDLVNVTDDLTGSGLAATGQTIETADGKAQVNVLVCKGVPADAEAAGTAAIGTFTFNLSSVNTSGASGYNTVLDTDDNTATAVTDADVGVAIAVDNTVSNSAGTYNTSTELISVGVAETSRASLASTVLDAESFEGVIEDGSVLQIGGENYLFAVGEESAYADGLEGYNLVDLTDKGTTGEALSAADTKVALQRLTEAAEDNAMFSVGYNGTDKLTLVQNESDTTDLSDATKIQTQIQFGSLAEDSTTYLDKDAFVDTIADGTVVQVNNTKYVFAVGEESDYFDLDGFTVVNTDGNRADAMEALANALGDNASYDEDLGVVLSGDLETAEINYGKVNDAASTYLEDANFSGKIQDGSTLQIGGTNYVFAVGKDSEIAGGEDTVVVDMKDYKVGNVSGKLSDENVVIALKKLETAASGNEKFTVAYDDANGRLSFTAKDDSLDTREEIQAQIQFGSVEQTYLKEAGSPLTLQIGDTSDSFNQMQVEVNDMHTASLGSKDANGKLTSTLADVDISTQEGAAAACDVLKAAINQVSDVRGGLGAIQNRLEHTINNLGVMQENLQNAESVIRDTDVADEMMKYTKNSILNQSAQAMLAQANQLPQGVLQLLQ